MPFFVTGQSALLSLTLEDGVETVYPRAYLWRNGTLDTSVSLSHQAQGRYTGTWAPSQPQKYNALYIVYSDAARTVRAARYAQVEETWQSLDGAVGPSIAASVWDELLAGHAAAGSAGEFLSRTALIEKVMRNRLWLEEGDTGNWVLYDDDSVTPLLTWSVTDKNGDPIRINAFDPARRTRGT
ncbi:MAG: hypothetical protein KJN79_01160 [Gammaproteobacteria bacterium]|nr:hypothetical protein [Gammaproteobacteria bacterium]